MNYFKLFIEHIKFYVKHCHSIKGDAEALMFLHLIEMMGEEDFNQTFTSYFINSSNEEFDDMFYDFHKFMRQTDFYSEIYKRIDRNPTPEDKRKYEYESIGGHLDMVFWNLIQISDVPYSILKSFRNEIKEKF